MADDVGQRPESTRNPFPLSGGGSAETWDARGRLGLQPLLAASPLIGSPERPDRYETLIVFSWQHPSQRGGVAICGLPSTVFLEIVL